MSPSTRAPGASVRRGLTAALLVMALVAAACSGDDGGAEPDPDNPTTTATTTAPPTGESTTTTEPPAPAEDRAYYILPPGNYGGIPTTDESLDQLALYDALTPLRDEVTDDDIEELFLAADFEPVGETVQEMVPRDGTTVVYDEFGVPHVTGETREDLAFGAGWVTARDRGLLIDFGKGAARAAVADIPGVDAFGIITSAGNFEPSEATEQLVTDQIDLIRDTYGTEGEELIADAEAYAAGATAWFEANGSDDTFTLNDVIAVTALIGSRFGAGGGSEAFNAQFLSTLQNALGDDLAAQAFDDVMLFDDPEAPTTIDERFEYGVFTGGEVTGSVAIDEGSVISLDPLDPAEGAVPAFVDQTVLYDAAGPVPFERASNWLTVDPATSVNDTTLAVMGPQLGYFYPEIVQQIHLSGPGIEAQGAAVPGLAMYILIGRTEDYAWSLTSANQDVRDVFAEILCEPDGSAPTRESGYYEFEGDCVPFERFDAGVLNGTPVAYPTSVHGPVVGTALSDGRPVALTRTRSTFGRDALGLAALKDMTEGDGATPEAFYESADKFGFTFNWGYANRDGIAYYASGLLPERAPGLDRRLPTLGTGDYEWQGFLDQDEHPHADGHPSGRLVNWNNKAAPGWMHGDGNPYGSTHRVELFDQWPDEIALTDVVGVMNRAATEDSGSLVWPIVSEVLASGEPASELAGEVVDILDAWVADDAPTLDADNDGFYDDAGPAIMDALLEPLAETVMESVFTGDLLAALDGARNLGGSSGESFIDKDLRTLLGHEVEGPFNLQYCGAGDLEACRAALWETVDRVSGELAEARGDDPTTWLREGRLTSFVPGLIPDTFRSTSRPTYQQVLEFAP